MNEPATVNIGPPSQVLEMGTHRKKVSAPVALIGSPGHALNVWCCIKHYADLGLDIPTNAALAQRCGISKSAVGRALLWLRREGWLA